MTIVFVGVVVGYVILMALYYINIPQSDYEGAIKQAFGAGDGGSSSAASASAAASASTGSASS